MSKPLLHTSTEARLTNIIEDLPQGLLLSGAKGVGLLTIGRYIARLRAMEPVVVLPERQEVVDVEKGTITIESIRRLYELTRTTDHKGRIVIIDYAERMGTGAQNAFLKLLEEPPEGTSFILLSHNPSTLLPTVLSRVNHIEVRPITDEQSEQLLNSLKVVDKTRRSQLLFIAAGLPAELTHLIEDEQYFQARSEIVRDARSYVTGNSYQRLLLAKKYKDDRASALILAEDAMKLLRRTLHTNGDESALMAINQLLTLHERLQANGNLRLQLAAAFVV